MVARIRFSLCWDLLWWIKMNLVWRWQMQCLQEYYFLHVETLCDASKQIFFLSILCSDCKMDGSDGSKWIFVLKWSMKKLHWGILWFIKTNFLFNVVGYMLFNLMKKIWICFSTYWKSFIYTFQPIEKNMAMLFNLLKKILAMLFNLLKKFWLCFSTCWKHSGYAFQLLKSYILWISGIWKV